MYICTAAGMKDPGGKVNKGPATTIAYGAIDIQGNKNRHLIVCLSAPYVYTYKRALGR
jgi:hypothetical protein